MVAEAFFYYLSDGIRHRACSVQTLFILVDVAYCPLIQWAFGVHLAYFVCEVVESGRING